MLKLETKNAAPSALAKLEIMSSGDVASVVLATEEVRKEVNGQWVTDPVHRLQVLTFIGPDGQPCSIEGRILDSECVEIASAHKVVVQVQVANELKATFTAGRVSKGYTSLSLVRVVEVWDSPKNCLWRAKDSASGAAARSVDLTGDKVGRVAA